ncbi:MAG: hypothetical protein NVSMB49_26900 [Ktedonobacteraceae bacterium]
MSNQEQQFYSSERYPTQPLQPSHQYYYEGHGNGNIDPREQQQQAMYDGPEYYAGQGEKLQPRPPMRRRRSVWLLWLLSPILLLILVMGIAGIGFGVSRSYDKHFEGGSFNKHFEGASLSDYVYNIAAPKFIINDNAGNIHIHSDGESGKANTVTIHIDNSGSSEPQPIVNHDKANGTITITATQQGFRDNNADVDITTPKTSDVSVKDDTGNVNIEGVMGNINAQTTEGRIDANNVSGQATLLSTNGDIHYSGSLDTQGSYKFDTVNGSVEVQLPSDAAFHLDAKSTNGQFDNEFGSDDVGSGTRPSLTVRTENGSIHVSKNG